ncbi:hypothetical protein GGI25_005193 [Coemansia spiralis]|uniref:Uncharacterized protein n=2 Tax=Coemansia TaxID=4863 RepID=A0A9W8G559_9FUNG|nr:hypothetical protein EDC05_002942 [Coemansia umbellata]KAJ2623388.1 hypothetical protein GGI26_002426 [Coemansia sp. RSA 1358]KAJ2672266.1 hypothetical protein GGI25_005193 [Coemansia spiralis]
MSDHKRKASTEGAVNATDAITNIKSSNGANQLQGTAVALIKRPKTDGDRSENEGTIVRAGPKRTSGLLAPIMHLTGHTKEITSCRFSPSGEHIASASTDTKIFLWNTYGDCANYGALQGHKSGVLEVQWMPGGARVLTASADKTVILWDATTGERLKRGKRHTAPVNSCCPLSWGTGDDSLFASASDDGTALLWDIRQRHPAATIDHNTPLTSIAASLSGDIVYTGSLDNNITGWDVRTLSPVHVLRGHSDTVMGIVISSKTGNYLLSTSLDSTVRLWDLRPYCRNPNRCERVFVGAPHGFEKNLIRPAFDKDEAMVASGSADRTLTAWNIRSGEIKYKLPGHKGCVTQVDFHPREPIVLSASVDRSMFLGEL